MYLTYFEALRLLLLGGAFSAFVLNLICCVWIFFAASKIRGRHDTAAEQMLGRVAAFELVPLGFMMVFFAARYVRDPPSVPEDLVLYFLLIATYLVLLFGLMAPGICGSILTSRRRR